MREKERFTPPAVGGASLLVIFAVLCLTVFALLGLSTVQAGNRLADASAKAVTDYYAADCEAERILAQLRAGGQPAEAAPQGPNTYAYSCPVSDTQSLEVEVRLEPDGGYTILRWQLVSGAQWEPEETIEVWDGTFDFD